jgi:hypothetical protein
MHTIVHGDQFIKSSIEKPRFFFLGFSNLSASDKTGIDKGLNSGGEKLADTGEGDNCGHLLYSFIDFGGGLPGKIGMSVSPLGN